MIRVLAGMYCGFPRTLMVVARVEVRTERGTVGYRRRVSLITALRMGRASISAEDGAVGLERGARLDRTSLRRSVCHFGWIASR